MSLRKSPVRIRKSPVRIRTETVSIKKIGGIRGETHSIRKNTMSNINNISIFVYDFLIWILNNDISIFILKYEVVEFLGIAIGKRSNLPANSIY